jgi:hypothetical protein
MFLGLLSVPRRIPRPLGYEDLMHDGVDDASMIDEMDTLWVPPNLKIDLGARRFFRFFACSFFLLTIFCLPLASPGWGARDQAKRLAQTFKIGDRPKSNRPKTQRRSNGPNARRRMALFRPPSCSCCSVHPSWGFECGTACCVSSRTRADGHGGRHGGQKRDVGAAEGRGRPRPTPRQLRVCRSRRGRGPAPPAPS